MLNYVKCLLITKILAKWRSSVWEHNETILLAAKWFLCIFLIVYQYLLVITESLHRISVYRQDTFLINWPIFTEKVTVLNFRELSFLSRRRLCFHINRAAVKANRFSSTVSLLDLGQTKISVFRKLRNRFQRDKRQLNAENSIRCCGNEKSRVKVQKDNQNSHCLA